MPNPFGQILSKPKGRQLVISDIHGCFKTLQSLITKISLTPDDQLVFLGDYVNKGPCSRQTLDYLQQLTNDYAVHPLLGNHDKILLDYLLEPNDIRNEHLSGLNNEDFFNLTSSERDNYVQFLSGLHHYFICGDFILVHAGINFNLSNPFLGKEDMLNIREFYYDSSKAQNKTIIHGHLPYEKSQIESFVESRNKILPLDNGCVYHGQRPAMGDLLCLNTGTMEITSQKNCD